MEEISAVDMHATREGSYIEHEDIVFTIGSKGEENILDHIGLIEEDKAARIKFFQLCSMLDRMDSTLYDMLRKEFTNEGSSIYSTFTHGRSAYLTIMRPDRENDSIGPKILVNQRHRRGQEIESTNVVESDEKKLEVTSSKEKIVKLLKSARHSHFHLSPVLNCAHPLPGSIIRLGPFHLSFDPQKKVKARKREALRIDHNLRKALGKKDKELKSGDRKRISSRGAYGSETYFKGNLLQKSQEHNRTEESGDEDTTSVTFKRRQPSLRFKCVHCGNEKAVVVSVERAETVPSKLNGKDQAASGVLYCNVCMRSDTIDVSAKSSPEDVYSSWLAMMDNEPRERV